MTNFDFYCVLIDTFNLSNLISHIKHFIECVIHSVEYQLSIRASRRWVPIIIFYLTMEGGDEKKTDDRPGGSSLPKSCSSGSEGENGKKNGDDETNFSSSSEKTKVNKVRVY